MLNYLRFGGYWSPSLRFIIILGMVILLLAHINRTIKRLHSSAIYVLYFLFLIHIYLTYLRAWLFPYFCFKWEKVVASGLGWVKVKLQMLILFGVSLIRGYDGGILGLRGKIIHLIACFLLFVHLQCHIQSTAPLILIHVESSVWHWESFVSHTKFLHLAIVTSCAYIFFSWIQITIITKYALRLICKQVQLVLWSQYFCWGLHFFFYK